jgi:hypothetical protein
MPFYDFWRRGYGPRPTKPKPFDEQGVTGTAIWHGYVQNFEKNPRLAPSQKYLTTTEILSNCSIVAAGVRYFLNLLAKPNWSVQPAEDLEDRGSSDEAKYAAEFVEDILYDMDVGWVRTVRRSGMYRFHGFGVQEWVAKHREDGKIGIKTIEVRPQHTICRWDVDAHGRVLGMWQTNPLNMTEEIYLPRGKLIYLVDDSLTDSPEGFGLLRHLIEPSDRLKAYYEVEGTGFERDFRGIPIARAPLQAMEEAVAAGIIKREQQQSLVAGLQAFVTAHAKGRNTGLLMDSSTHVSQSDTGTSVSSVKKWDLELLTGSANGIENVGKAIERTNREIARILGVENLLVGDVSGSRALSEDKSRNLYLTINSAIGDIAEGFELDLVGAIWWLNGLDNKLKPTLKVEEVAFKSAEEITSSLRDMAVAGAVLSIDDPAINDVRDILGISRQVDNPEPIVEYAVNVTVPRQ